jgi:tape measure domain-containing protein
MADNVVEIQVKIVGADAAKKELSSFGKDIGVRGVALGTVLGNALTKGAELAVSGVKRILGGVGDAIKAAASFEDIETSLTAMTGSSKVAGKAIDDLQKLISKTPLQLEDAQQSLVKLIGTGFGTDDAIKKISQLSDILSGTGRTDMLDNVIFNLGQIRSQGKAATIDLRQFATAGIPIYEELTKVLGVSGEQLQTMIEDGKIGIKEIEKVFESMTGESGRFYQLSEKRSKTFNGILSNIKDTMFITLGNIAKQSGLFDIAKDAAGKFYNFINANQGKFVQLASEALKFIRGMVESFGKSMSFKTIQAFFESLQKVMPSLAPAVLNLVKAFDTLGEALEPITNFLAKGLGDAFTVSLTIASGNIDMFAGSISALGKALKGDLVGAEKDLNGVVASAMKAQKELASLFGVDLTETTLDFSKKIKIAATDVGVFIKELINGIGIAAAEIRVKLAEMVGDNQTADAFRAQIQQMTNDTNTFKNAAVAMKAAFADQDFVGSLFPAPENFQDIQTIDQRIQDFTLGLRDAGYEVNQLRGFSKDAMQTIFREANGDASQALSKVKTLLQENNIQAGYLRDKNLSPLVNSLKQVEFQANKTGVAIRGGLAGGAGVFGKLQKVQGFAEGGIVGGSSTKGDKQMVRANSGEMFINRNDQAGLFKMIKTLANQPRQVINANFDQGNRSSNQAMGALSYMLSGNGG